MNKTERERAGLIRRSALAKMVSRDLGTINHHRMNGNIPFGLEIGGDILFNAEMVAKVKAFFAGKRKWER